MFEAGFTVSLGLLIIMFKAPWPVRMWMLSNPIKMDISVFIVLYVLHMGTYSGGMAATLGALMVSLILSAGRKIYGHRAKGKYIRGMVDVGHLVK
jgi:hypothetical protein